MKKWFFLFLFFLCSILTTPLMAQEKVPLRVGVRDGYARLVFDWNAKSDYTVKEIEKGKLVFAFTKNAEVENAAENIRVSKNITGIKVNSTEPLNIEIDINKNSKYRDFTIGKRVILDVYDVEGETASVAEKPKEPEPKPQEAKTEPKVDPPEAPPQKEEKQAKTDMPAAPPAIVLVPENLPDKQSEEAKKKEKLAKLKEEEEAKKQAQKKLEKASKQVEHVISFRSTETTNIAAHLRFNTLYITVEGNNPYLKPDISSPTPNLFSQYRTANTDQATIYAIDLPKDNRFIIKGLEGGLVWSIVLGEKVKPGKPVIPQVRVAEGRVIFPLRATGKVLDFPDPDTGETLKVVTVEDAIQLAGNAKSFVDFDLLDSPIGIAVRPKVADLKVSVTQRGVEINRPEGLELSSNKDLEAARIFAEQVKKRGDDPAGSAEKKQQFYKFKEWKLGTENEEKLVQQESILLSSATTGSKARQVEDLLTLGKLFLSHGRGAESLGYFDLAQSILPDLQNSGEFLALRGVAKALDWKTEDALKDFLRSDYQKEEEVKLWQSYVLADLGDWQQAVELLPQTFEVVHNYPENIANRLAPVLAEVNLRDGRVTQAEDLISLLEHNAKHMIEPIKAYLLYLEGEAARQKGEIEKADKIWDALSVGKDDLYRTKAGLALTILRVNEGKIDNNAAIDNMERLRYAWRGDELEAQVNYWLGNAYFKNNDYLKGLFIMREAASIAGDTLLAGRIAKEMQSAFTKLFLENKLEGVSPLDAIALYDQFSELTPIGDDGDKLVRVLAEHLVSAGLLDRAAKILKHQVDHRLKGEDRLKTAIRLAGIELINKTPQNAVNALNTASSILLRISDEEKKKEYDREITLLKTKAYLQNKQYKDALTILSALPKNNISNRLRADIAWQGAFWEEAAEAIDAVLSNQSITQNDELTEEQVNLIMNRAIALNLIDDRISLANMRSKYIEMMKKTDKGYQFEVITRSRKSGVLADRKTLMSIVSEVDLFQEFLEKYKEE